MLRNRSLVGLLLLLAAFCPALVACSDDEEDEEDEYYDWKNRNEEYFENIRNLATDSITQAKRTYGTSWEDYCNWRAYLSYSYDDSYSHEYTDSVYINILERGDGEGCPYLNDSVRVFYRGRIIPTTSYPEGYVFSYSGQSSLYEQIFSYETGVPSTIRTSSFIKGVGTALLYMHIGDLWRIYVPQGLGYGSSGSGEVPAYSTLIFEVQLVDYFRNGEDIIEWN